MLKQTTTYYINTTQCHKKPQIIFMIISTVYKLINDIDDKVYVGSTCSKISKRITEHRRNAKEGRTSKLYQYMRTILHNPTRLCTSILGSLKFCALLCTALFPRSSLSTGAPNEIGMAELAKQRIPLGFLLLPGLLRLRPVRVNSSWK